MAQGESDGLVFITYTNAQHGGKIKDPRTRQKVRKQAWNAWWSQESDRRLQSRSTRPLKQSQGRFRIRKEPLDVESATPLEQALLASPSPFQTVVESIGEQAWDLLNYYFYRFRQNSMAINVEGDWIAFTFSNKPSRHAQLALVALNTELEAGAIVQSLAMKHTAAAVKLIRSQLEDTNEPPDDALVGAVALLVIIESMQDDKGSSAVHFHGLNNMIAVRGGFDAFSETKTLQRVISWARRCYWLRWHNTSTPASVPSLTADDLEHPLIKHGPSFDAISLVKQYDGWISYELAEVLADFRFVATFPSPVRRTIEDRRQISKTIYAVEYKLILLHEASQFNDVSRANPRDTLYPMVRNAAQLYVFVALRQMLGRSRIVQKYSQALRSQMSRYQSQDMISSDLPKSVRDLLIWTSTLLLSTTYDDESRHVITPLFRSLIDAATITNLEQLMLTLQAVAWMEDTMNEELELLWKTIHSTVH